MNEVVDAPAAPRLNTDFLRLLAEGTASATGDAFFRSLARHAAQALGARYAFAAESLSASESRSLAYWEGGDFGQGFSYRFPGTPCERVSQGHVCATRTHLQALYPEDRWLVDIGADSYVGVPMRNAQGRVLGHIAVLHTEPMSPSPEHIAVLEIFAARGCAELERMQAERALREATLFSERVVNSAASGVLVCDQQMRYRVWNPYMERMTGLPASEVLGRNAIEYFPVLAEPEVAAAIGRAFQGEVGQLPDTRLVLPNSQTEAWMSCNYGPYHDADGHIVGVIALINDVSARRRAEMDLRGALEQVQRLQQQLERENVYLREEIRAEHNFEEIVGTHPALTGLFKQIVAVAASDAPVLIQGETGTGKELVARALHSRGPRRERPLVKINCGAISAGLVESELFGHVKGAFTGALTARTGRFELADGGTLFLDEVGELPAETQVKLLRVLQEQEFEPVGSNHTRKVDVRVIAATNRRLEDAVREGRFRADLYYRLNVIPLRVPPLRERRDDIALLGAYFLQRSARKLGRTVRGFTPETLERLRAYDWPGNVRELQNLIERSVVLAGGPLIEIDPDGQSATAETRASATPAAPADLALPTLEEIERRHIRTALERCKGVIEGPQGAAQALGLNASTVRSRMKKLGIGRSARG